MATKLTNVHGLPEEFMRAAQMDRHWQGGDYSVTQLIDSPQIRVLKRQNDIEEDVMDRLWLLFGTGMHKVMEQAAAGSSQAVEIFTGAATMMEVLLMIKRGQLDLPEGMTLEKTEKWIRDTSAHMKTFVKMLWPDAHTDILNSEKKMLFTVEGKTISGTADKYDPKNGGVITDYKFLKTYGAMSPDTLKKYKKQLNLYGFGLRENGIEASRGKLIFVLKDWSRGMVGKKKDYPQTPVIVHDFPLLEQENLRPWVTKLVKDHIAADNGEVRECTDEEMWKREDVFKVKKVGGKNALPGAANFTTLQEARDWIASVDGKYDPSELDIEEIPGSRARCEDYCAVSHVCPQYQSFLKEKGLVAESK